MSSKNLRVLIIMMDEHLHKERFVAAFSDIKNVAIALIISGSHWRILQHYSHTPRLPKSLLQLDKPILGICYGFQWFSMDCK